MIYGWRQKTKKQQQFHRINGFLSLQLWLRLELGFRLRLTNMVTKLIPITFAFLHMRTHSWLSCTILNFLTFDFSPPQAHCGQYLGGWRGSGLKFDHQSDPVGWAAMLEIINI